MAIQLSPSQFKLSDLKENSTVVLLAKRRSGKSVCIKHLMYHFHTHCGIKTGIVCSHTEDADPFYCKFFPPLYIYNDCEHALRKVMERQKKIKEYNNKSSKKKDDKILVVLDDVIDDINFVKSKEFNDIMTNGRHYGITFIIAIQYVKALPPVARQNFDYIFLFNNDITDEIHKIYQSFAGIFPSEKIFKIALQTFTKNYQIMIINQTGSTAGELNDKYAIFKASMNLPNFFFGSHKFNKLSKQYYNPKWKDNKRGLFINPSGKNIQVYYN